MNTDEIRAALTAATPGPWYWRNTQGPMLMGDRSKLVMSFERMGMHGAQPLFRDEHCVMQPGGRANLYSFPDAHLIANAPAWLADLLAEVDRLTAAVHMYADKLAEHECEAAAVAELGVALEETSNNAADYFDRALAAEQAVQRVRGIAEAWATQPNDYDEDTEQQIEDGNAILRALDGGES